MTDSRPGSFKKEAPAFFKDGGTDETKNSGNDESSSARSMSPQFRKQQQALLGMRVVVLLLCPRFFLLGIRPFRGSREV